MGASHGLISFVRALRRDRAKLGSGTLTARPLPIDQPDASELCNKLCKNQTENTPGTSSWAVREQYLHSLQGQSLVLVIAILTMRLSWLPKLDVAREL